MPNEFVIKNGFISKGNSIVEGGITATTISASTYLNLPSPSITVGTSQLTSGTDGRVLFQSGTTLQQDGNFTFDPTLKRLVLRAVGTAATDIPFTVQNSAGTTDNFIVNGLGEGYFKSQQAQPYGITIENTQTSSLSENTLGSRITFVSAGTNVGDRAYIHYHNSNGGGSSAGTFIFSSPRGFRMDSPGTYASDNYRFTTTTSGNHLAFTASGSGNILRLNVAGAGSTSSEIQIASITSNYSYWRAPNDVANHAMSWGRTSTEFMRFNQSGWLGIGTGSSVGARLDVRAQGALSTDIAFRVRNSADNADLFRIRGNASTIFGGTGADYLSIIGGALWGTDCYFDFSGGNYIRFLGQNGDISIFTNSSLRSRGTYIGGATQLVYFDNGGNIRIGQGYSNMNQPDVNATRTIQQMTGVAPTTSVADGFQQYSADITAGNAAPHFRTENGAIVKVYQETTAVAASTLVGGGGTTLTNTDTFDGYTLQQVVKALRNLGILQ